MNGDIAHHQGDARRVDVYVDPACPWSWITSRWLTEVAAHRDVDVHWQSYSLLLRDGPRPPPGMPPEIAAVAVAAGTQSLRLLRVFEALRDAGREEAIGILYTAWGRRVFLPGPPAAPAAGLIGQILDDCRLGERWHPHADDPAWDAAITRSMETVSALTGRTPVTPTVVVDAGSPVAFTGPVFSPSPTGAQAARVWDAIEVLLAEPGFYELNRPKKSPIPQLPVTAQPTG